MENTNPSASSFHHAAILDFASSDAVQRYEKHEDHFELMKLGSDIVESISEVNYDID